MILQIFTLCGVFIIDNHHYEPSDDTKFHLCCMESYTLMGCRMSTITMDLSNKPFWESEESKVDVIRSYVGYVIDETSSKK